MGRAGHFVTRFPMSLEASFLALCHWAVTYLLRGSALTDTFTDNLAEMCQLKLTCFCPVLYHLIYTILILPLIPRWLSQVVMTGTQTYYPEMRDPAF